jgi:hypothetical protein
MVEVVEGRGQQQESGNSLGLTIRPVSVSIEPVSEEPFLRRTV